MDGTNRGDNKRRILGRVTRAEFVGRADELGRIVSHPNASGEARGLLILLAPEAGVSELLRQTYDELFNRREETVPVYFALPRAETTAVSVAIEFLNTFLLQYIAYQRNEPTICHASLVLSDVLKLAPLPDRDWIEELLEAYNRGRFSEDDQALVRLCLGAPQRVPLRNGRPFVMIDTVQFTGYAVSGGSFNTESLRTLSRSNQPFAFAGLRRQVLKAAHDAGCSFESIDTLRLEKLKEDDARRLVEFAARRQQVDLSDEIRDLLVQQFDCSPFFTTTFLQAAREKQVSLTSYLACERLYVDELMGGHLHRYFGALLDQVAPQPETRRSLIRLLAEASVSDNTRASFEAWRRMLRIETAELEALLQGLHVQELLNWDGVLVEAGGGPTSWQDYLKIRFRLDIQNEPRALVVADTIATALKRAPETMTSHYRRAKSFRLRDLVAGFNSQLVPRILFHYDRFKESYRGATPEETMAGLDAETDLIRLPQVFHAASCTAFSRRMLQVIDNGSCVVAHAFEAGTYADANEIVWLGAEIDSNLEVDGDLAEVWRQRLEKLANGWGFGRISLLLVSKEGFSPEACALLDERGAYAASRQQVELLAARLGELSSPKQATEPNEFVVTLPMGDDNEILAATIVEKIARRSNFRPEAINQIKTAIVEACINAAEHSLSPDRKIYQRFRVENDRLVITISSRGVVPSKQSLGQSRKPAVDIGSLDKRRGWGLKLIRSLMDEVEFEQVDDGTSLRMTKYLRNSSS